MSDNPFAGYNVEVPKKYAEQVKSYCKTGGGGVTYEFAPFDRQVDFWYFSLIYAVNKGLDPEKEAETSNITHGAIFSEDPYRIPHILLMFLGRFGKIEDLANYRKVFNYANSMAHAGIPYVLQILGDEDDRPLWALLEEIERAG